MHTKPISTEVIASYEATLISGFAELSLDKGKIVMSDDDTFQGLRSYRQKMVDHLNNGNATYDSAIELFRQFQELPMIKGTEGCTEEEHPHMHAVFQAVVAYPLIRNCFEVTPDWANNFRREIMEQFPEEMENNLKNYFTKVDSQCQKEWSPDQLKLDDMLGHQNGFGHLLTKMESVRTGMRGFPLGLLHAPRTKKKNEEKYLTSFQTHCRHLLEASKEKKKKTSIDSKNAQFGLLPVLFIIGTSAEKNEGEMADSEKTKLIKDLKAAEHFYNILPETDHSKLILQSLRYALKAGTLEKHGLTREDDIIDSKLVEEAMFKFLYNFHHVDKCFQAISAFSRLTGYTASAEIEMNAERSEAIQIVNDLIKFWTAFKPNHETPETPEMPLALIQDILDIQNIQDILDILFKTD